MATCPVLSADAIQAIRGQKRSGTVGIREFDAGIMITMQAQKVVTQKTGGFGSNYFLVGIPNVSQPPDHPGVPVVFSNPEDVLSEYRIPVVVVRRNDVNPAMNRWAPGNMQYRAPAPDAQAIQVTNPVTGEVRYGYDKYVQRPQAVPFDIMYTLRVIARNRGGKNRSQPRNQANAIFMYLASIFQPYSALLLLDSAGAGRSYSVTVEYGVEDETLEVTDRLVGYTLDLTVEAELDLNPEETRLSVWQFPSMETTLNG